MISNSLSNEDIERYELKAISFQVQVFLNFPKLSHSSLKLQSILTDTAVARGGVRKMTD